MAKVKLTGCQACPLSSCKEQNFIIPTTPDNPEVIILFSVHNKDGVNNDVSGLLGIVESCLAGRKAIFIGSQQCPGEYSLKSLTACREAYVNPIIDKFPGLPILSLGEKSAHILLGYKAAMTGKQGMSGKVVELNGHDCYFTFGETAHREHIEIMLKSIFGKLSEVNWTFGLPPKDFWDTEYIVCDIEHTDCNPYLGGKIDCIGISNDKSDRVFCLLPTDYAELFKRINNFEGAIVGHNFSSDMEWLCRYGVNFSHNIKIWDTMIHRKLRPDAPERGFGLKFLVKQDYVWPGYESKVHGCWHREEIPALEDLAKYNAYDVLATKKLFEDQREDERNSGAFFTAMDYIPPMVDLMHNGIYVNPKVLSDLSASTMFKILQARQAIQKITGKLVVMEDEEEEEE